MRDSFRGDFAELVNLTEIPLDQVARLCEEAAEGLPPEEALDSPVLRRAVRRLRQEALCPGEIYVGHSEGKP